MTKRCTVTKVRAILLVPAALAIAFALLFTSASPAGAHPLEHCSLGWTEVNGVPVEGSPEEPRTICRNDFHRHLWRNIAVSSATFVSLFTLLYALIVTPEAFAAGEGNPPRAMAAHAATPPDVPNAATAVLDGALVLIPACLLSWLPASAGVLGVGVPAGERCDGDALRSRLRIRRIRRLADMGAQAARG